MMRLPRLLRQRILLCVLALLPATAAIGDPTIIRRNLATAFPGIDVGEVTRAAHGDLWEVILNGTEVGHVDAGGNVLFLGRVLDLKRKVNLVEERQRQLRHIDFATLPLDKAIVTVKGDGSRRVAVFSDPDCPFCQRLEGEFAKLTDVTIYTFLYPITSLHPDAPRKSHLVWCAPNRSRAWDDLMLRKREPAAAAADCQAPLGEIAAIARRARIAGTPGIVFENGYVEPGMIEAPEIEKRLSSPRS